MENRLTGRQEKWFASVQGGLERETGRSLQEWIEIAKSCPAGGHRARLKWFKDNHNLLQNRASYVLSAAFPPVMAWDEPNALGDALWTDPRAKEIYQTVRAIAESLPDVVAGQRKSFSAWSREFQFVAVKPVKQGVLLGLAVRPEADKELSPAKKESWSERLKSTLLLTGVEAVNAKVAGLIRQAWEGS